MGIYPEEPLDPQVYQVRVPWLLCAKNNRDISSGDFVVHEDRKRGRPALEQPDVAYFNTVFEDEPVVLLWLNTWCFSPKRSPTVTWDVSVSLTSLQSTRSKFYPAMVDLGRVQETQAWPEGAEPAKNRFDIVAASWLAFPRNLTGIDGGVFAFRNPKLVKTNVGEQGRQRFGRGKFTKAPKVFFGLKGFHTSIAATSSRQESGSTCPISIRMALTGASRRGWEWVRWVWLR